MKCDICCELYNYVNDTVQLGLVDNQVMIATHSSDLHTFEDSKQVQPLVTSLDRIIIEYAPDDAYIVNAPDHQIDAPDSDESGEDSDHLETPDWEAVEEVFKTLVPLGHPKL